MMWLVVIVPPADANGDVYKANELLEVVAKWCAEHGIAAEVGVIT